MSAALFGSKLNNTGIEVQLEQTKRSLFRKSVTKIPADQWIEKAPTEALAALARLDDLVHKHNVDAIASISKAEADSPLPTYTTNGLSLQIPHNIVAGFTEAEAKSLGLPASIPLTLRVAQNGPLTDDKTTLTAMWTDDGGRQIRPKIIGAFAKVGDTTYRVPEGLYKTINAIENFNAENSTEINVRLAHLAHLKSVTQSEDDNVLFEQRLQNTRFSHAKSFSLEIDSSSSNFRPVLHASEDNNGNRRKLLNDSEQNTFVAGFRKWTKALASYFISNDHYLFVDPTLTPALTVVREVQDADETTRQNFLRSPSGYIRDTLEDRGEIEEDTDYAIDELFNETEQFSQRVIDIGIWEAPKISTPQTSSGGWIPEVYADQERDQPDTEDTTADVLEEEKPIVYAPAIPGNIDETDYQPEHTPQTDSPTTLEIPRGLTSTLRHHQEHGLFWMQRCWAAGMPGALLADDMGVGKTIQSVAFLRWLQDTGATDHGPIMVVAPVSLLDNWQNEIATHLDNNALGQMALLYGTELRTYRNSTRKDISSGSTELDIETLKQKDLLLTTYETLRDYSISMVSLPLTCLVFDEMQKVKNPGSLMTRASKSLNAKFTLGLTGTPVENSVADLWCMLDTLLPGELGSRSEFLAEYGPGTESSKLAEVGARLLAENNGKPPPILRRMKTEIGAELPTKTQQVLPVEMPTTQRRKYDNLLEGSGSGKKGAALALIQNLRSISLHPTATQKGTEELTEDEAYISQSGRMKAAFNALDDIHAKGEKALVFIENLDIAAHLALLIRRRYKLNHTPARIYGATPANQRQRIVNDFSNDSQNQFNVLVLSPKAAGVGLNIVAANHVIHLSRWWNPAVEDQCTDRAYRIKQSKPVSVYIPQSIHAAHPGGSFDEKLHELLEDKRNVSRDLLCSGESGTEANELLKKLTGKENSKDTKRTRTPTSPVTGIEPDSWELLSDTTLYKNELEEIQNSGCPPPVVGEDLENNTGEVIATLEWAWPDFLVGLIDHNETRTIEKLQAQGWKIVVEPSAENLSLIKRWLLH